jgi:hypothetical protein
MGAMHVPRTEFFQDSRSADVELGARSIFQFDEMAQIRDCGERLTQPLQELSP